MFEVIGMVAVGYLALGLLAVLAAVVGNLEGFRDELLMPNKNVWGKTGMLLVIVAVWPLFVKDVLS
jgi:dolichol kinase